jgi:nicotinate-nucleotide--dimethylbenzimidazole phosphoribosyltransferase
MVANFDRCGAAVNQIADVCDAQVRVFDVGVGNPTADMSQGPAMGREECAEAIMAGVDAARTAREDGFDIVCLGEMGIGNSTAAAALTSAFTGAPLAEVVGRGAGLDDETLAHKIRVLEKAFEVNGAAHLDVLGTLAALGGREISMMAGIILGGASVSMPIVSDGFISGSAVLAATALAHPVLDYIIFSHRSVEPGHDAMYRHLEVKPLFDLDMRLGEGTGAVLSLPMIRSAARIISGMETFEEAGIIV